jgi:hypothetical protein
VLHLIALQTVAAAMKNLQRNLRWN